MKGITYTSVRAGGSFRAGGSTRAPPRLEGGEAESWEGKGELSSGKMGAGWGFRLKESQERAKILRKLLSGA